MKKIVIIILSIFILTGCNISNSIQKEKPIEEYCLTVKDLDLKPGIFFNTVKSLIGPFNSYDYDEEGNITFYYDDFEIETYFENETEKVSVIRIANTEKTTNEGIKIGDSKNQMIKTYGKDYQEENNKYSYKLNNTYLSFTIDDDIIIEIEYHK